MSRKILVAPDGSVDARKAIGFAPDIALKYKATVYLIHVISLLTDVPEQDVRQRIKDNQQEIAKETIEEAEREVKKKDLESYQTTILQDFKEIRLKKPKREKGTLWKAVT